MYQVNLNFGGRKIWGLAIPGIPVVVVGSNGSVAWGVTSAMADGSDFVRLERCGSTGKYSIGSYCVGETDTVSVRVRGGELVEVQRTLTPWGAVVPINGEPWAVRWIGMEPTAVNLRWGAMLTADDVEDGVKIGRESRGPPLAVAFADTSGDIGWTLSGSFPRRVGGDDESGWVGIFESYDLPSEAPYLREKIVLANQRLLGEEFGTQFGRRFSYGARAVRIDHLVDSLGVIDESVALRISNDVLATFYEFYRQLVLSGIGKRADSVRERHVIDEIRAWDGKASNMSRGLVYLHEIRSLLRARVAQASLAKCHGVRLESLSWVNERSVRRLLLSIDWSEVWAQALIKNVIRETGWRLLGVGHMLNWGNRLGRPVRHPLARAVPGLDVFLSFPPSVEGCKVCVRVNGPGVGVVGRLIVAPDREQYGKAMLPAGQSGNPLSEEFQSHHASWISGEGQALSPQKGKLAVLLIPSGEGY